MLLDCPGSVSPQSGAQQIVLTQQIDLTRGACIRPYLVLIWPYWVLFGLIEPYLALTVKQKRNTEGPHRGHRNQ